MKKLSETYKDLGIAFEFPIEIKDQNGNEIYYENICGSWYRYEYDENGNETYFDSSSGFWYRYEYNENGNKTYFENSGGYWYRGEYDDNGKQTYFEDIDGVKRGTKKGSCAGKIIEVGGRKYKLTEL